MSFIDKFLDQTTYLPRMTIRYLKLYKVVENRSNEINTNLKNLRENYLQKLKEKEKEINNNEMIPLRNSIDELYKESLILSDYKQEILKEISYIFEDSFLKKITPIIEEGEKECQDQILSSYQNGNYSTNSYSNHLLNKKLGYDFISSMSELNDKKKKNDLKFLGNKKNRTKKKKKNSWF